MAARQRLTRREQQALLRQRILDSALGVFRRTGFARATIQEVAELAGCTRGSVYLHFGSKADLWVAVLEEHADERIAAFRDEIAAADGDEDLMALLAGMGAPAHGPFVRSLVDLAAVADDIRESQDEDLLARVRALQRKMEGVIGILIERLCAHRGVEPPRSPETLAALVLSLHQGLAERAHVDADFDLEAHLAIAVDLMLSAADVSSRSARPPAGGRP